MSAEHLEPEGPVAEPAVAIPVAQFEGDFITDMEAVLPRMAIEMPSGYQRGTHLRMSVEVRVKGVRYEELKNGDLKRQHILAIESIELVSAFDPAAVRESPVVGNATGPEDSDGSPPDLGVQFGRTSDTWGAGH